MKKLLFILIFSVYISVAFSQNTDQNVTACAGDHFTGSNASIAWTLGESISETFTGNELILTQGFHQTNLTVTTIYELPESSYEFNIWPNPAKDIVTISVKNVNCHNPEDDKIKIQITDITGKLIFKDHLLSNEQSVNISNFSANIYLLSLKTKDQTLHTFKIFKNK